MSNDNINESNDANNEVEWYETLEDNLGLPSSDILKYKSLDIASKYGLDTSTVDTVIYFLVVTALVSMIFLYFKANGYSLGIFLKGLHKHMYLVGKGPKKIRAASVKKVIIPNSSP